MISILYSPAQALANSTPMLTGSAYNGYALTEGGTVWSWGYGGGGGLGTGNLSSFSYASQITGLSNVTSIAAGYDYTYAVKSDGTVWGWGDGLYGALGAGVSGYEYTPVQISSLTGVTSIATTCSADNTLTTVYVLKSNGTVWSWGYNSYGQLGNNSTAGSSVPVQVSGLASVTAITSGNGTGYALKSDGTVWAWGNNSNGQLGNGTVGNSLIPVKVAWQTGVTAISSKYLTCYSLQSNGTVWSWGQGTGGQLGNAFYSDSSTPVQVSGLTQATAIAASSDGCYATTGGLAYPGGEGWAWGLNTNGQLGNGSGASYSNVPVRILEVGYVANIGAGPYSGYAEDTGGTIWCWGYNGWSQLGYNSIGTDISTPVYINPLPSTINVTGLSFGPASIVGYPNTWYQTTATISPSNASNQTITYTSSDNSVATISSTGYLAHQSPGQCTVTATTSDGGYTSTVSVVTLPNPPNCLAATNVTATGATLTWSAVPGATEYFINQNTIVSYVTAGTSYTVSGLTTNSTYMYSVFAIVYGVQTDKSANIYVTPQPSTSVTGITLGPDYSYGFTNSGMQMYATVSPSNAANQNVTYSSSNSSIASISSTGYLTYASPGSCIITATSSDGGYTATATVYVVSNPPDNLVTSNVTATGVTLNWSASPNATEYIINQNGVETYATAGTTYNVSGLTTNTNYNFSVFAVEYTEYTNNSSLVYVTPHSTVPSAPTNLQASGITPTSFGLNFNTNAAGDNVTSYNIYLNNTLYTSTTSPPKTVTGLGTATYTVTLTAVNAEGESAKSSPIYVTTLTPTPPPTNLQASNITPNSITLTWQVSNSPSYCTVYENGVLQGTTNYLTYTASGLTPSTSYNFTVSDTASPAGESTHAATAPAYVTTLSVAQQLQLVPTNLQASNITMNSLTLTWQEPWNATLCSVYQGGILQGTTTSLTYNITSLTPGTSYTFTVTDTTSYGESAKSSPLTVQTTALPVPTNLQASNIASTSLNLTWQGVADPEYYTVYQNGIIEGTTTYLNIEVDNLSPGVAYNFYVTGTTTYGESGNSNTVTATTLSQGSIEITLQASNITSNSLTLTWEAVSGSCYYYTIYQNSIELGTTTSATYPVSGLSPSTTYTFIGTYTNEYGESSKLNPLYVTTLMAPPSAPLNIQANTITSSRFNITFNYNASSENVTHYTIYLNNSKYGSTITTSPQTITGLNPSTTYTVALTATNVSGESPKSLPIQITTPAYIPPPTNLVASNVANNTATLTWSISNTPNYCTVYQNGIMQGTTTSTTLNFTGLAPSTTYTFTVTDTVGTNESDKSTGLAVTTLGIQQAPTNLSYTYLTSTSLTLNWQVSPNPDYTTLYEGDIIIGTITTSTSYPVTGLVPSTSYTFTLTDTIGGLESAHSLPLIVTTPAIPTSRVTTTSPTKYSIVLTWPPYPGAISYNVLQDGTQIATTTKTTYTVTGLTPGVSYVFTITINNGITPPPSYQPVTAIPSGDYSPPVVLCNQDYSQYWDAKTRSVKPLNVPVINNQTQLNSLVTPGQFIVFQVDGK